MDDEQNTIVDPRMAELEAELLADEKELGLVSDDLTDDVPADDAGVDDVDDDVDDDSENNASDDAAGNDDSPDDNADSNTSTDNADDAGAGDDEELKGKSRYAREGIRNDRSWKALDQKKAEFNVEVEKLESDKQQISQQQQLITRHFATLQTAVPGLVALKQGEELKDRSGFTASEYLKYAKSMEEQGNEDAANAAKQRAADLHAQSRQQINLQQIHAVQNQAFLQERNQVTARVKEEMPEFYEKGSELNLKLNELIKQEPDIMRSIHGPYLACRLVKAQSQLEEQSAIKAENENLKKELEELRSSVSLGADDQPSGNTRTRSWEEMSLAEQEAAVERDMAARSR